MSSCRQSVQDKAAQHSKEHDAMVLKMAEIIKSKVEEMMASEAVQQRIQHRLKEERAALEDKVVPMLKHILSFCATTRQSVPKCIGVWARPSLD